MKFTESTVDAICECCSTLVEVKVRKQYDAQGHLRMTTFECQHCDDLSFVQAPHPNSVAGIARRQLEAA